MIPHGKWKLINRFSIVEKYSMLLSPNPPIIAIPCQWKSQNQHGTEARIFIFARQLKSMQKVPSILVCNDDGITAPGIKALAAVAREFGNVSVVAPDSAQSGMGHAITIGVPLRLVEEEYAPGFRGWACTGTPADCVKLATGVLLPQK